MQRPDIQRLGTIDFNVVEVTPVTWRGRLLRFEYINRKYHRASVPNEYFHFVDAETDERTEPFALGFHFGSAHVQGDTMYVFGLKGSRRGHEIHVFRSNDLQHWDSQLALKMDGWKLLNNSICRGPDGYIMAFEVDTGNGRDDVDFTTFYARSDDLMSWTFLGEELAFSRDHYTGCPTIRWHNGWYYIMYLVCLDPRMVDGMETYETHIARTRDLQDYEISPLNPFMGAHEDDRIIANPDINTEQRQRIALAPNINTSDLDLNEHDGEVVIYYNWGAQAGIEYMAEARYHGALGELLEGSFTHD